MSGNSIVIIITGDGKRTAESYDGVPAAAPLLHVEYNTGPPNEPPVANNDSASTPEDTAVTIDVAANDTDPDGNLDPASANTTCAGCTEPVNGTLLNNGDGSFEYTPTPDFNGSDSFVYEICDTLGACDTAAVNITVDPVADPPVANDDSADTSEYTWVTIDVAANDTDTDDNLDPATSNTGCGTCTMPADGMLLNNGDGTFNYRPNLDYIGQDSFVYEICDTLGACDTAAVNITVTPTNDPPTANDDTVVTPESTGVTIIDVAVNDTDPDDNLDPTTANSICAYGSSGCNGASNGALVDNGDGSFDYTPNPDFNGPDSFVYEICDTIGACDTATVSITVECISHPPMANDDSASTTEDTLVTIDVAANDSYDPCGNLNLDPTTANSTCANGSSGCTGPANGSLINTGNGTFEYTPNPDFNGSDSFVYEICDTGGSCDTATVSITVNPLAPDILEVRVAASSDDAEERDTGKMSLTSSDLELVFDRSGNQTVGMRFNVINIPPGANITNAYIQFQVDETLPADPTDLTIQGEDVDNALTFTSATNNISSRPRTTAGVAWSPVAWTTVGEAGPDEQTSNIASIVQEIVNRPGWVSGNSLVIIITGTGERTAEAYDGVSAAAPLLHVEYNTGPPNDPPVANDDNVNMPEDTLVTIDVAANDTDPEGSLDPTSANTTCPTCADPAGGALVNNGDGSFDYTPNPDFNGPDSFVYEICDTIGACDTAAVNITVDPVDDPPVANYDTDSTSKDTLVTIDVAANDIDPDGNLDPASANTTCGTCAVPTNGILVNNGDGTFDYTPNPNYSGPDSFVYEICDSGGLCDTAAVSITVNEAAPTTLEVQVAASSDDAEERAGGAVNLTSSDLELTFDRSGNQTVGMRFNGINIPQGANIANAYIQFQVDETIPADPTNLSIQGEDIDNAATFTAVSGSITSRPRTTAEMLWSPVPWTSVGEAGPDQQTPDITAVIQEIVDRAGWTSGNSLVIIITGTGERTAESYDGVSAAAPLLHVEYVAN
jgi:hypothetical protein